MLPTTGGRGSSRNPKEPGHSRSNSGLSGATPRSLKIINHGASSSSSSSSTTGSSGGGRSFQNKVFRRDKVDGIVTVKVLKAEMIKPSSSEHRNGGKPYSRFILNWRNIKMEAFSYKDYAIRTLGLLHVGNSYKLQGELYSSSKDPKFHRRSKTNSEKIWIFEDVEVTKIESGTRRSGDKEKYTINQVKHFVENEIEAANLELENVTLVSADIYRYRGCPNHKCQKSFRAFQICREDDDVYYYSCPSCNTETTYDELQLYMILRNITLSDQSGISLRRCVCFNDESEKWLGKKADYFEYDEMAEAWLVQNFIGSKMNLELSVKEACNKGFPMDILIEAVAVISPPPPPPPVSHDDSSQSLENHQIVRNGVEVDNELNILTNQYQSMSMHSNSTTESGSNDSNQAPLPEETFYKLDSNPSGLVLIINNNFSGVKGRERLGSQFDIVELTKTFESFNFEVSQDEIDSKEELETKLSLFQRKLKQRNVSCSIVVLMSHGKLNNIELGNNELANIWTDIVNKFGDSAFPEFRGRPKIFIFSACQKSSRTQAEIKCAPVLRDIMLILPGLPGNYTYRLADEGTFFIQKFVKVLRKYGASCELSRLVKETQRRMASCPIKGTAPDNNQPHQWQLCYSISLLFDPFRFPLASVQNN